MRTTKSILTLGLCSAVIAVGAVSVAKPAAAMTPHTASSAIAWYGHGGYYGGGPYWHNHHHHWYHHHHHYNGGIVIRL